MNLVYLGVKLQREKDNLAKIEKNNQRLNIYLSLFQIDKPHTYLLYEDSSSKVICHHKSILKYSFFQKYLLFSINNLPFIKWVEKWSYPFTTPLYLQNKLNHI